MRRTSRLALCLLAALLALSTSCTSRERAAALSPTTGASSSPAAAPTTDEAKQELAPADEAEADAVAAPEPAPDAERAQRLGGSLAEAPRGAARPQKDAPAREESRKRDAQLDFDGAGRAADAPAVSVPHVPSVPMTTSLAPPPPPPPAPRELRGPPTEPSILAGDGRDDLVAGATLPTGPELPGRINGLVDPREDRLSTFAIDVDTGSYSLARRFLESGSLPNAGVVRVEEWVNAFHYSYPDQGSRHPFSIHMEGAPLAKQTQVLRIGIQGKRVDKAEREPVHLTFLVDVSGSMQGGDRLPLARQALKMLVDELGPKDSVSLVTYAGSTGVVLPATAVTAANKAKIKAALDDLRSGGGTAMGSGMELAYREAGKALGDKGSSRVIVLSDGDANIGRTSFQEILKSIKGYVSEGVTMSTVGFGTGNYRDQLMEQLADAGNGNYSYVGSLKDAKKIFVDDLTGTLQVIAKDTKIQVEMNPDVVASYRLIGYENRDVADQDFRNDKVDAGEIGAGHTVTALYEVTLKTDDPVGDLATVRVRYKSPRGDEVSEVAQAFPAAALQRDTAAMSPDGRFAVGVGLAAEVFRHSPHMDRLGIDLATAHRLLQSGAVGPHAAERRELVRLIAPFVAGAAVATR